MSNRHILAADIGGTKTLMALYGVGADGSRQLEREASYPSRNFASLEAIAADFLPADVVVSAAAFAVAGPVVDGQCRTTNLPWHVTPAGLAPVVGSDRLAILNDLEALALGAVATPASALHALQPGVGRPGHRAVIAAGTGLGQALLFWNGSRHLAGATEGGHADFAPGTPEDEILLQFARRTWQHLSWERIVSGPGLHLIHRCLTQAMGRNETASVRARLRASDDPSAIVGEEGVAGSSETCREAVDWFVRLYGAQAGNLALTVLALGGIYVGGGIIGHILPRIEANQAFIDAFCAKGRYEGLLREIPVYGILEARTGLWGAADAAARLL